MSVAILIPARYRSARFPGKPLAQITLPDGTRRSLLHLTWEAACAVPGGHPVHVLTDDPRIAEAAMGFGASVILTAPECRNGTERCAEAAAGLEAEIIVNLQGDAPLTPPWFVADLIAALRAAPPEIAMATPVLRCDPATHAHLLDDRRHGRVGATTALFDAQGRALYFSKELLPWHDPARPMDATPVWHHVGVYAYRRAALAAYAALPEGQLERLEGLEQLRFLEHGHKVLCVEVAARGRVFWEVNHPEDIPRIEAALRAMA